MTDNIMQYPRALMLEGSNGLSFFLHQTLLDDKVVEQVDLAGRFEQATDLFSNGSPPYQLIVINLLDTPELGLQLGKWLNEQSSCCPVILIVSLEDDWPQLPSYMKSYPFVMLPTSTTLAHFSQCARLALTAYARP